MGTLGHMGSLGHNGTIVNIGTLRHMGTLGVIKKSDNLYMGSVTATCAHHVQTFCLLPTPSSSS